MGFAQSIIQSLIEWDVYWLLKINGLNAPWLDTAMWLFSSRLFWLPLYFLLLFLAYQKGAIKGALWLLLIAVVAVALADQISVHLFKFQFERLRPCRVAELQGILNLPAGCRGQFGFVSSHAANTSALALVVGRMLKIKWLWILLSAYVLLNCYSRIYLGVHYPADVIGGVVLGVAIGSVLLMIYNRTILKT